MNIYSLLQTNKHNATLSVENENIKKLELPKTVICLLSKDFRLTGLSEYISERLSERWKGVSIASKCEPMYNSVLKSLARKPVTTAFQPQLYGLLLRWYSKSFYAYHLWSRVINFMFIGVLPVYGCTCPGSPEEVLDPQKLKKQKVMNCRECWKSNWHLLKEQLELLPRVIFLASQYF